MSLFRLRPQSIMFNLTIESLIRNYIDKLIKKPFI